MGIRLSTILVFFLVFLASACKKQEPGTDVAQTSALTEVIPALDTSKTVPTNPPPVIGLEIGNKAPGMELTDSSDRKTTLYSIKNKLILLDFWASWCKPCRMENRKLIDVYRRYKDTAFKSCKGFEIFSVSIDQKKYPWKKCLEYEKYNWPYNLIDSTYAAAVVYQVSSIPKNFLIDQNGIILAKDLRDTIVEKTLISLLK